MESPFEGDTPGSALQASRRPGSYSPSFIDRLLQGLARLPAPPWFTCLAGFALQSTLTVALAWGDGWLPRFTVHRILLIDPLWLWGPLAVMAYLNAMSLTSLTSFGPLLDSDEAGLATLRYRFTTMPARHVLLTSLTACAIFVSVALPVGHQRGTAHGVSEPFQWFVLAQGVIAAAVGGALYYHSVRQLRLVSRAVRMVKAFDLFRLDPLYAFSRLTARTGIAWMLLFTLSMVVVPFEVMNAALFATYLLQVVLVVAAFALPLQFLHQHIVAEKRQLLGDLDQRTRALLEQVHGAFDRRELAEMEHLERGLKVLTAEREVLTRIPTWPWRAGTLRGFMSAVALPIVLFVIQMAIERWLVR